MRDVKEHRWPASRSERLAACPGSLSLMGMMPDSDEPVRSGAAADAGKTLHAIAEHAILNNTEIDIEIHGPVADYVQFVRSEMANLGEHAKIMIEKPIELRGTPITTAGRIDAVIMSGDHATIVDFKSGAEVVDPHSHQMMIYAGGILCENDAIRSFRLVIIQPRCEKPISEITVSRDDVIAYMRSVVIPAQHQALEALGFVCEPPTDAWSEKWLNAGLHCNFCPAKKICPLKRVGAITAGTDGIIRMIRGWSAKPAKDMGDDELRDAMYALDEVKKFVEDVEKESLKRALDGMDFPGMCVTKTRPVKRWINESSVAKDIEGLGIDPYEKKLKTVAAVESEIHVDISALYEKRSSGHKLVHAKTGVVPDLSVKKD